MSGGDLFLAADEAEGRGRWLTYEAAGAELGISADSVKRRAQRSDWPRRIGNEGRALVLVPPEALAGGDNGGDGPSASEGDTSPPARRGLEILAGEIASQAAEIRTLRRTLERRDHELAEARLALERLRAAAAEPVRLRQPSPPGYRLERIRADGSFRFLRLADGSAVAGFASAWSAWRAATADARRARDGDPAPPS